MFWILVPFRLISRWQNFWEMYHLHLKGCSSNTRICKDLYGVREKEGSRWGQIRQINFFQWRRALCSWRYALKRANSFSLSDFVNPKSFHLSESILQPEDGDMVPKLRRKNKCTSSIPYVTGTNLPAPPLMLIVKH